jgi:hypothetical protein
VSGIRPVDQGGAVPERGIHRRHGVGVNKGDSMVSRFSSLVVLVIASGALIAGCGSSSHKSSSSSTPAAASTPAATSAGSTPGTSAAPSTTAAPSTSGAVAPAIATAVATCKSTVNAEPTLTAAEKSQLDAACDKAAHGDLSGVQKIAAQVCQDVAKQLPAASQAQAEAACPKS